MIMKSRITALLLLCCAATGIASAQSHRQQTDISSTVSLTSAHDTGMPDGDPAALVPQRVTPNATVTDVIRLSTGTDSTATYSVYLEQTAPNELQLLNLCDIGAQVKLRLNADKSVEMVPQKIGSNSTYGDFFCYKADWTEGKLYVSAVEGQGNGTQITLGSWAVSSRLDKSLVARRIVSTTIAFAEGTVSYPQKTQMTWTGDGTESSPYTITTPLQMQQLAESVNEGQTYSGKHIALGADINMSSLTLGFRPIGTTAAKPFSGNFDGKGHSISNLQQTLGEENNSGLFGYADEQSTLKNITLDGVTLKGYGMNFGLLAGYSNGIVKDINVKASTLTALGLCAGGIVGAYDGSEMSNVSFSGAVQGVGATGGIVGMLKGNLSNAQSAGTVKFTSLFSDFYPGVGGAVGMTMPKNTQRASITNCLSTATVTDAVGTGYTGGLIGSLQTGTLEHSFSTGAVTSRAISYGSSSTQTQGSAGGLAGTVYGATVTDCYAAGRVVNTRASEYVGGLIGLVISPLMKYDSKGNITYTYTSHIESSYTSGQTTSPTLYSALGLYGKTYSDTIFVNCYYDRQLTGSAEPEACAKETAFLTSGAAISGLAADKWVFAKGLYPRLKGMENTDAALLSASPATLGAGETVLKVKSNFTVSSVNGVSWKLYDSAAGTYSTESTGLQISGDSVKLNNTSSSETLVAFSPSGTLSKSIVLQTVNPSGFVGSGTEADPYLIQDKQDFIALNNAVVTNKQDFKGDFFKQTNDIDIAYADDFTGVGNENDSKIVFAGTFDGQGYAIHNLKIGTVAVDANNKPTSKGSSQNVGLFGYTSADATIKNVVIAADCQIMAYSYAGSIVGRSAGKITGCRNYASVTTTNNYAGGITGYLDATGSIENCYNEGRVATCGNYAAGIAAFVKGDITYCQNNGEVMAAAVSQYTTSASPNYAAGIAANLGAASTVSNNVNAGRIYSKSYAGGITNMVATAGTVLKNNINYGIVDFDDHTVSYHGAIVAREVNTKSVAENNIYDSQIGYYGAANASPSAGMKGLLTRELAQATTPEGFPADKYDWQAGMYPVLKAFKDEPAANAARRMVVTFADADNADDMNSAATLASFADSLKWTLTTATGYSISGNTVSVSSSQGTQSLRDTLVATIGGYSKAIALRSMPSLFEGSGTETDPYQIKTTDDMARLAKATNEEFFAFGGRYFKVMNDIDFTGATYTPVANSSVGLDADFDGNKKTFKKITYENTATTATHFGIFGMIGPKGRLHELTLDGSTITGYGYTAAFAGKVSGTVENCLNKSTVKTSKNPGAAGIAVTVAYGGRLLYCSNQGTIQSASTGSAGIAYETEAGSRVENCTNDAAITVTNKISNAGIVSSNGGTVVACSNNADIYGSGTLGGIVSKSLGGDSIIGCTNNGKLIATASTVGGIVATKASTATVTYMRGNSNYGTITGAGKLGGIAGSVAAGIQMDSCYNYADIKGTDVSVGGVIGICPSSSDTTIVVTMGHCANYANVSSAKTGLGGFAGEMSVPAARVTDCHNEGSVSGGTNYVGGFAGKFSGKAYRCYNTGSVSASGYGVGGFAGISPGEIHECFNLGDVTATGSAASGLANAGGLWGYGYPKIYDSYNMGKVTANGKAGGLNGCSYDGAVVSNSYNAGQVVVNDSSMVANITTQNKGEIEVTGTYYDTWVNPGIASPVDNMAKALTTRQLAYTPVNENTFEMTPGMYPILKNFKDIVLVRWYASIPVLAEGDTVNNVRQPFLVGESSGVTWTSSPNITLNNGVATPTATGEAWVTKTYGDLSKTYNLYITQTTSIQETATESQVTATEYFSTNGVALGTERPTAHGIYVVKEHHANGTVTFHKAAVR